jgi:hypothetical protein
MNLAPIVLFVYNRPIHTKKTVQALLKNKLASQSILYIYSDYPKKEEHKEDVKKVREYIHTIKGFKEIHIIERKQNYGLAKSIIEGVIEVINKYGRIIVIEDDLITSHMFLTFMNNMLETYEKEKKIYSITRYNYPPKLMKIPEEYKYDIYFSPRAGSWGWATWKDRWNKADWEVKDYEEFKNNKQLQKEFNKGGDDMTDMLISQMEGKLDSWAIRWCYTLFKNNAYCVYPTKSYIDNIGMDGSGVHCGKSEKYKQKELNIKAQVITPEVIELNQDLVKQVKKIHSSGTILNLIKKTRIYKLYRKMKSD